MTDPQFHTREELKMWAGEEARKAKGYPAAQLLALALIRRVTAAHMHLFEEIKP